MLSKKKHIIKVNRKKLSTQKIREKENFEELFNEHRKITKRPVYKQKKFYFFLFLILVITVLIYYAEKEEKETQKTEQTN